MKKIISLLLVLVIAAVSFVIPVMAEETAISVLLDGEYITFDVAPTIVEGRTMVPVRAVFEALGATVVWKPETQKVLSQKGDTQVTLTINDKTLYKNGEAVVLDVPAQLIDSRTLVPVRAISEAFGCYVDWNNWTKTVLITSDLNKTSIATVNEEPITMGYFNFMLLEIEEYAMASFETDAEGLKSVWGSASDGTSFGQYIASSTLEQCIYIKANVQKAKEAGITLSEDDEQRIEMYCSTLEEVYQGQYTKIGTTIEAIKELYADNHLLEKYHSSLLDEHQMTEEEAKKYLDENYVQAKHILFSTIDAVTGAPLAEEEIAAKKKLAEQVLTKIRNGSNFDKMIEQYNEDPGMEQNPDGYLFTTGEMIAEFEKAAFELAVGEVSGIVETVYGYHIIKRVSNGTYLEGDIAYIQNQNVAQPILEAMSLNANVAEVTLKNNFILQVVPVGLN